MSAPASTPSKNRRPAIDLAGVFTPNRIVSKTTMIILIVVQVVAAVLLWVFSPFKVLPQPGEVFTALGSLWTEKGLGQDLIASLTLNGQALLLTMAISLVLSYLTVMPFFRPIVEAVSKGRFLSLVGFTLIFTLMLGGGHPLKLSMLVFGMTVFFLTSMASEIAAIPKERFDYARTLRMGEWRVVWEVVVLGTADKAFEILRQNAAIGWMMLTMVEGIARSQGGVGVTLLNMQKHFQLPEIYAIQIAILAVGIFQDAIIGWIRRLVCPYSVITLERKTS